MANTSRLNISLFRSNIKLRFKIIVVKRRHHNKFIVMDFPISYRVISGGGSNTYPNL